MMMLHFKISRKFSFESEEPKQGLEKIFVFIGEAKLSTLTLA